MKFKTTLILFAVFSVLLALVLLFEEFKGGGKESDEDKLVSLSSDDVQKIMLKRNGEIITFQKTINGAEGWIITEPIEAKADKYEVDRLADNFSNLRIERVVEEEPGDVEKYEIPKKEITLWLKDREKPVKILVGAENPLDNTFFAKREDETRVVLIPSHLKDTMEKSLFEFRQKDIFRFETDDVKRMTLRTKNIQWEAEKKEEEWFFEKPVKALAVENKISGIIDSLSGLIAKEFVSEEKQKEDLEKFGLNQPDYEISLSLPVKSQELQLGG